MKPVAEISLHVMNASANVPTAPRNLAQRLAPHHGTWYGDSFDVMNHGWRFMAKRFNPFYDSMVQRFTPHQETLCRVIYVVYLLCYIF
jgi:hypothetical protein